MKTCKAYGCKNTELVYSGIDAVVLEVSADTYCYPCANIYAQIKRDMNTLVKS